MRLQAMTVGLLRQVIGLYEQEAWADNASHPPTRIPGQDDDPVEVGLEAFTDEAQCTGSQTSRRYTLRLGNARYPFMKLVLQEHLVQGEFFFEVDTHDQMFDLGEGAEAARFEELKRYNQDIRERVDKAWAEHRVPTTAALKGLIETTPTPVVEPRGKTILVVDDDACIAQTLALLLQARGYTVTCLSDGRDAIEVADPELHDLILMDNDMVHLNGFEACHILKSREETRQIPVLIATAGSLTLRQLDAADGFLVKPFQAELLFSMLEHLLERG